MSLFCVQGSGSRCVVHIDVNPTKHWLPVHNGIGSTVYRIRRISRGWASDNFQNSYHTILYCRVKTVVYRKAIYRLLFSSTPSRLRLLIWNYKRFYGTASSFLNEISCSSSKKGAVRCRSNAVDLLRFQIIVAIQEKTAIFRMAGPVTTVRSVFSAL